MYGYKKDLEFFQEDSSMRFDFDGPLMFVKSAKLQKHEYAQLWKAYSDKRQFKLILGSLSIEKDSDLPELLRLNNIQSTAQKMSGNTEGYTARAIFSFFQSTAQKMSGNTIHLYCSGKTKDDDLILMEFQIVKLANQGYFEYFGQLIYRTRHSLPYEDIEDIMKSITSQPEIAIPCGR
eukprot:CAMPEP_0115025586 /NCGR_PEP_ID=MMETSP0216-20121206/34115_1 /TAXON_ID=223996 /ORGANISM="Protocruzia adherens, Strain Boccale" /LENGTH=177 /DNA_ID=CAMNT_0002400251 /DNA_START=60 /DNA_END=594 /DNA_ORIENTATION=+